MCLLSDPIVRPVSNDFGDRRFSNILYKFSRQLHLHPSKELAAFFTMSVSQRDKSTDTSYNSPAPIGVGNDSSNPTMTRSSRKRTNDNVEDEERLSAKRSHVTKQYRSKISAQRMRRISGSKGTNHTQPIKTRSSTRRRSAPTQTCQYGAVDEETEIEEDGKEGSTIQSKSRPATAKSTLELRQAAPTHPSVLRMNKSIDHVWNRKPNTPSRARDEDGDMRSDLLQDQVDEANSPQIGDDGGFDIGDKQPSENEANDDAHLNEDPEILSQIVVKKPQEDDQPHGDIQSSDESPSYKLISNNENISGHEGRRAHKSISIPGRQNTPLRNASRRSSRLRSKDCLDTLLESTQEVLDMLDNASEFQLKRRQDNDKDDEDEAAVSNNETPSPSGIKVRNGQAVRHDEDALCLPSGYTRTGSPRKPAHSSPLRELLHKETKMVRSKSARSRRRILSNETLSVPDSQEFTDRRPRAPSSSQHRDSLHAQHTDLIPRDAIDTSGIDDFHARLLKKGIRFSFLKDDENETTEDHNDIEAEIADTEIESDQVDEMQEVEFQYPEYQQNIRDALADVSEAYPS